MISVFILESRTHSDTLSPAARFQRRGFTDLLLWFWGKCPAEGEIQWKLEPSPQNWFERVMEEDNEEILRRIGDCEFSYELKLSSTETNFHIRLLFAGLSLRQHDLLRTFCVALKLWSGDKQIPFPERLAQLLEFPMWDFQRIRGDDYVLIELVMIAAEDGESLGDTVAILESA